MGSSNGFPDPLACLRDDRVGFLAEDWLARQTIGTNNMGGSEVQTLISDFKTAGYHSVNWNASSYPSGMYFAKIVTGEFTQTQKVVLVK